jgi:Na+/H+ antiporter NhaC
VFFDDYANCLIVGNAMRPLSDRLKISREKLAYIVDSTAAPIASVALVSTWIGYEVSLMAQGLEKAGVTKDAYAFFVEGIGYRSYSLFTIAFVGMVAVTGRDFGPMVEAEARATQPPKDGEAQEELETPTVWEVLLGVVPVVTLVAVTFAVLWIEGSRGMPAGARVFEILGNADGYDAMVKASMASVVLAIALAAAANKLTVKQGVDAAVQGMTGLFHAIVILVLAWSLGSVMGELDAANYLVEHLGDTLAPWTLPTLVFLIAAGASFATGTSFGTMAILVPIALPLAYAIAPDDPVIHLAASSAVLTGSCWGDHCSPISDTTVLSAAGSGCDLVAHVRTQLPYAVACGLISIVFGTLPAGFGISLWITIPLGVLACYATMRILGKPVS